jgi:adenosylcobinamide hydrolase
MEKKEIFTNIMGDKVWRIGEAAVVEYSGKRLTASTSALNGGVRDDIKYSYNKSCGRELHGKTCPGMKGNTHQEHYSVIAQELGLDPECCTGMGTAALIENIAVVSKQYGPINVQAAVTAGVDVNGGRAGDPAGYDELTKKHLLPTPCSGTINIFLFINANMPSGTLARAMVTATEAKTAALNELMACSRYSSGLATGSGTDSLIAIANAGSELYLENAGKHCKLGELIGVAVKEAVKEALDKQTGMNPQRQCSVIWQNKRYGITEQKIWQYYSHIYPENLCTEQEFGSHAAAYCLQ